MRTTLLELKPAGSYKNSIDAQMKRKHDRCICSGLIRVYTSSCYNPN